MALTVIGSIGLGVAICWPIAWSVGYRDGCSDCAESVAEIPAQDLRPKTQDRPTQEAFS